MDKGKEEKINFDVDSNLNVNVETDSNVCDSANVEGNSNVDANSNVAGNANAENGVDEKVVSVYLDRIEELEDGTAEAVLFIDDGGEEYSAQINLPSTCLPENVSDGDYLTLKISYDAAKTQAALESARQLLND